QRDERVPAPVGEPWIARHDRHAGAAPHQIRVCSALQGSGEGVPAGALRPPEPLAPRRQRRLGAAGGAAPELRLETPQRVGGREIPGEAPGRREILDELLTSVALLAVQESAVPLWLVPVGAVASCDYPGNAVVGAPRTGVALAPGVKPEAGIFVVQRVVIAAGQERPHDELGARNRRLEPPRKDDARRSADDEDLLLDFDPVLEAESPRGPGDRREGLEAAVTVRRRDAGRVALRAQREAAAVILDPRIVAVHEDVAPRGRRRGHDQEGVVAPCANPAHRSRGAAPQAVSFEPLGGVIHGTRACARSSMLRVTSPVHPVWGLAPTPRP